MKNRVETIIGELYEELARANPDACRCTRCRDDVITFTLNQARPRYGGTLTGQALISVELQGDALRAQLAVIMLEAMRRVGANPRHDSRPAAGSEEKKD